MIYEAKAYLWESTGLPTLMYGMDSIYLSKSQLVDLRSAQGSVLKRVMGFGKRCHHTALVDALGIKRIDNVLRDATANLHRRMSLVTSPANDLQAVLLSLYCTKGIRIRHTMVDRLLDFNISPLENYLKVGTRPYYSKSNDGVAESLRFLIYHDNFIKYNSDEHLLARLLLRSF